MDIEDTESERLEIEGKALFVRLVDEFKTRAKDEGIPLIEGSLREGHNFIHVSETPFDHFAPVRHQVTFALVELAYEKQDKSHPFENLRAIYLHLRLGQSNLWLTSIHEWPPWIHKEGRAG